MSFEKRKISKTHLKNSKFSRKKNTFTPKDKKNKKGGIIGKIIFFILLSLFLFGIVISYVVYQKYLSDLPKVTELENLQIAESSIIYDRNGKEIYRIFKENRTYVPFDAISKNMVNAIVAGEDQRFWENPGFDLIGLARAVLYRVIGKSDSLGGTSTLTQQLIRNTIIENRSSGESFSDGVSRKIKEIYLSYEITNKLSKEKILELYLNKIGYGSNAHGIEQAAKTFFGKSAKELNVLESSILASLPKGPTYYSPYNNYDRLVGYPYVYNAKEGDESRQRIATKSGQEEYSELFGEFISLFNNLKVGKFSDSRALVCGLQKNMFKSEIAIDPDGCSILEYSQFLKFLNSIKIQRGDIVLEYQTGRKDFILGRMLEDNYVSFDQYREAFLESLGFEFQKYREDIKYPHFVFYVREYLEKKYGKELIEQGGLRIYTSLDSEVQDEADRIIKKYATLNETKFIAKNAALISLDNVTGEIIAMVGGKDYFDIENGGNVNIITSDLQPGSTFKPFVYSLAIDKEIIGTKTPVYDVPTTFPGSYTPKNFDGKFMGKMNISTALNNSRNIPAIKMYYLAGGEDEIVNWMAKLGVETLARFKEDYYEKYGKRYNYGAPLGLGTGLMTPLELAEAYSVYANLGLKKELVPILKIVDVQGLIIEEHKPENNLGKQVIDPSTAFILNHILSDTSSRPQFWNTIMSLSGRSVAAKTGTSSMQYQKNGKQVTLPRNLWMSGYTPQVTTVVWSGNTDGTPPSSNANGLEASGPIWKEFMEYIHKQKSVEDWSRPSGVKEVNISNISGMLSPEESDKKFIISSLFKNPPQSYDAGLSFVEVDMLCRGPVTENTPLSAKGTIQLVLLRSLRPQDPAWENPVQAWVQEGGYSDTLGDIGNFVTSLSDQVCERSGVPSDIQIGSSIENGSILVQGSNNLEIGYKSSNPLKKIQVHLDDVLIADFDIVGNTKQGIITEAITIDKNISVGEKILRITGLDAEFYGQSIEYRIIAGVKDTNPPEIIFLNPSSGKITLFLGDSFNLRAEVQDASTIRSVNIYIDDTPLKIGLTGKDIVELISTKDLLPGLYTLKIDAIDAQFNTGTASIVLDLLN